MNESLRKLITVMQVVCRLTAAILAGILVTTRQFLTFLHKKAEKHTSAFLLYAKPSKFRPNRLNGRITA